MDAIDRLASDRERGAVDDQTTIDPEPENAIRGAGGRLRLDEQCVEQCLADVGLRIERGIRGRHVRHATRLDHRLDGTCTGPLHLDPVAGAITLRHPEEAADLPALGAVNIELIDVAEAATRGGPAEPVLPLHVDLAWIRLREGLRDVGREIAAASAG